MQRFTRLLSVAALIALLIGFVSPTSLFTGLGLVALLLLLTSLRVLGTRVTVLLLTAGVVLPVLAESYGAERSLRMFAYPVVENFTPKLFLFALDTASGLFLMTASVAILGAALYSRYLVGTPATAKQKTAWTGMAIVVWLSTIVYVHPSLPAFGRLAVYGLIGCACALPFLRTREAHVPLTTPLLVCMALTAVGWTAQSIVTLIAGLVFACLVLIRTLVVRGAHTA